MVAPVPCTFRAPRFVVAESQSDALPARGLPNGAEFRKRRLVRLGCAVGVSVRLPRVKDGERERERRRRADSERDAPAETLAERRPRAQQRKREKRQRQRNVRQPFVEMPFVKRVVSDPQPPAEAKQDGGRQQNPVSARERQRAERRRRRRRAQDRRRERHLPRLRYGEVPADRARERVWDDRRARAVELPPQESVPRQTGLPLVVIIVLSKALHDGLNQRQLRERRFPVKRGVLVGEIERQKRRPEQNRDGGERGVAAARERDYRRPRRLRPVAGRERRARERNRLAAESDSDERQQALEQRIDGIYP